MVVTLVLKGIPHSVDLRDLADNIKNVLCADEIGSFIMRSLPNHHRTNKRLIGLDFESGFDAMPAQGLINGYEYVTPDGKIHTIQAKIGTAEAVMACGSVYYPDVTMLKRNDFGYSMLGASSIPELIGKKQRIIERMKKEIVKEYEELHYSDSEDSSDGKKSRRATSSSLEKKSKRKKRKRDKSPSHSIKKKRKKSVGKKKKKIKKESETKYLKRHRHRSTSSEESYDRVERRRLTDESDHSLGCNKKKRSKLKGYSHGKKCSHKPKVSRITNNELFDVSDNLDFVNIREHIDDLEKSRETDNADRASKKRTHKSQVIIPSSKSSLDSEYGSPKYVKEESNLKETTRDINTEQTPKICNNIVTKTTEKLLELKKEKRKCKQLQNDDIIVKSEPQDEGMEYELGEVKLSTNEISCSVVTDLNRLKHVTDKKRYNEQNIHQRNHTGDKTVKPKDDIWDVIDEVFRDIPENIF